VSYRLRVEGDNDSKAWGLKELGIKCLRGYGN
jgi:hypothetical protein